VRASASQRVGREPTIRVGVLVGRAFPRVGVRVNEGVSQCERGGDPKAESRTQDEEQNRDNQQLQT
jgi:hypothetical protein